MAADTLRAAGLAVKLLLTQRFYSIKIEVARFRYDKKIIFDSFYNYCKNTCALMDEISNIAGMRDGYTIRKRNGANTLYIVLYNEKIKSPGRRNFTLAHEVGHIYLGHECDGFDEECEADHFAAELLLPRVVVWEIFKQSGFKITARELAGMFGVSEIVAKRRLNMLLREKKPEFSPDEQLLLKKFRAPLPLTDDPVVDY